MIVSFLAATAPRCTGRGSDSQPIARDEQVRCAIVISKVDATRQLEDAAAEQIAVIQ
jgi:hypothetical protein